jgi:hypothetical protein
LPGKNRKPIRRQILKFSETEIENRNAYLSQLGAISRPGNGDFESSPPALHPPFMALSDGVSSIVCSPGRHRAEAFSDVAHPGANLASQDRFASSIRAGIFALKRN